MMQKSNFIKCRFCDWKRRKYYFTKKKQLKTIDDAWIALIEHCTKVHYELPEVNQVLVAMKNKSPKLISNSKSLPHYVFSPKKTFPHEDVAGLNKEVLWKVSNL